MGQGLHDRLVFGVILSGDLLARANLLRDADDYRDIPENRLSDLAGTHGVRGGGAYEARPPYLGIHLGATNGAAGRGMDELPDRFAVPIAHLLGYWLSAIGRMEAPPEA